ncbi:MAG: YfhO family protein [Leadbetterella sp.]
MKLNFKQNILPILIAVGVFFIVCGFYFSPVFSGKTLQMGDVIQSQAGAKESIDFVKSSNGREMAMWTNSMFGGMPSYMIGISYNNSYVSALAAKINALLPAIFGIVFSMLICFYIFVRCYSQNNILNIVSSLCFGFSTYGITTLEAGHVSKLLALGYGLIVLAGIIRSVRGEFLFGGLLVALGMGFETYANHVQITYYFVFIYIVFFIYEALKGFRNGNSKSVVIGACIALLCAIVGVGTNTQRLWTNAVYSNETIRGKSELKKMAKEGITDGLGKEYAFEYSYGWSESMTLLYPNFMGGGSGQLGKDSEVFKTLNNLGVDPSQASQFIGGISGYFGELPISGGPAYLGILVVFFFLLGFFIEASALRWSLLVVTILVWFLALGSHFSIFNDLLFNNLPLFNKFRSPNMTLNFLAIFGSLGLVLTLHDIVKKDLGYQELKKPFIYSLGIILILTIVSYFSLDFTGKNDTELKANFTQGLGEQGAQSLINALILDRDSLVTSSIMRGMFFIALAIAFLSFRKTLKISNSVLLVSIGILSFIDLYLVDKDYLSKDQFVRKSSIDNVVEPSAANLEILKDTDPHYRVLNLTTGFWADARDSYFHKSIGGYHAAKLKKIQELYDNQMVKDGKLNMPLYNMLNAKYFIVNGQNNQPTAQRNVEALGNVWFVDSLLVVSDADAELNAVGNFNPKTKAIIQSNQGLSTQQFKTEGKISLKEYGLNKLSYTSDASTKGYAVFSEIWYRGNIDWQAYIDGKVVPHQKVNYVLRGLEIPSGKHEIVFEFKPESVFKGKQVDLICSILVGLLVLANVGFVFFKKPKE